MMVPRRTPVIALLLIFVIALFSGLPQSSPVLADAPPGVQIETLADGLRLTWQAPEYNLSTPRQEGRLFSEITMDGLANTAAAGQPSLPQWSELIALPPDAEVDLHIVSQTSETITLAYAPLPALSPLAVNFSMLNEAANPSAGPQVIQPDVGTYAANQLYPAEVLSLSDEQTVRGRNLARLSLTPVQVNPVTKEARIVRTLVAEVRFSHVPAARSTTPPDAIDSILRERLLNPDALTWPRQALQTTARPAAINLGQAIKLTVSERGIYAVSQEELATAGFPVDTLDPQSLQLSRGDNHDPVAILVEGEGDSSFDPGDRVIFYADPAFSVYTASDTYFLSYGESNPARIQSDNSALPAASGVLRYTVLAEENQIYESRYPSRNGERWYWERMDRSADPGTPGDPLATHPITLTNPSTAGPTATLTIWVQSFTDSFQDPNHRVQASLNGTRIGESTWKGRQTLSFSYPITPTLLNNGENLVSLFLPGVTGVLFEGMWLDAFAITYPLSEAMNDQHHLQGEANASAYNLANWPSPDALILDVSNPAQPIRHETVSLNGAVLSFGDSDQSSLPVTYHLAGSNQFKTVDAIALPQVLTAPAAGADYIIVAPAEFNTALAPLVAHRGLTYRVFTSNLTAIYDTYGAGRVDPEAIRRFLQDAYQTWTTPAPQFVLLVGDTSYDPKDYLNFGSVSQLPPYLAEVDPWIGETASDARFVTFGSRSQALPDMLVGRLPVNNSTELSTVIDKIIQYESNPTPGAWNENHLFVTDNPDEAGDFFADSDGLYNNLQSPIVGQRFYLGETASEAHIYTDPVQLRNDFLNQFNAGASLVTFHGHSSWHQWAEEALFRWSFNEADNDVSRLQNQYRLPMVLGMTCFTGYFHHPEYPTIDESMLRQVNGGSIAVWSASGLGIATGHNILQDGFYEVISGSTNTNLGLATLAGKTDLVAYGFHLDLLDTFNLLGDPGLRLDQAIVPFGERLYLPLSIR